MRDAGILGQIGNSLGAAGGRVGGILGAGYNNLMNNLGGGPQEGLDPAQQAAMRQQMLFQLGSALSSGGNVGEAMMRARDSSTKSLEALRADRARKAKLDAMRGAMGPRGFDRNTYLQSLMDAGVEPDIKELGDWASLAKTDAEAGKVRTEAATKSYGLASQLAQGGALFHSQVAQALSDAGAPDDQIPALLADPQKLIAIGMTPEEAQKLALERDKFGETRRANMADEGIAAGQLGVARGNLGLRGREVDLRERGVGGYAPISVGGGVSLEDIDAAIAAKMRGQ